MVSAGSTSLIGWNLESKMCTRISSNNQFFQLEIVVQVPLHNHTLGIHFVIIIYLSMAVSVFYQITQLMTSLNSCDFADFGYV